MPTFNFELNSKPSKRGTYLIMLRITQDRKKKRTLTGIELKSKNDWNSKRQEVRKTNPNCTALNKMLEDIREKAKTIYEDLEIQSPTAERIIAQIKEPEKTFSFIRFVEDYTQRTLEAGQIRTAIRYKAFLVKLKYYINGVKPEKVSNMPRLGKKQETALSKMNADLQFEEITLPFVLGFTNWLKKVRNYKHPELVLHHNSISKLLDNFRSLFKEGVKELRSQGLDIKSNPFDEFKFGAVRTSKEKLTEAEIKALEGLKLEAGSLLELTRNCFLFSYYTAGIRAGDLLQLRGTDIYWEDNEWRLSYKMNKTSFAKDLLLIPEAIAILKHYVNFEHLTADYIFPLLDSKADYAVAISEEDKDRLPYDKKESLIKQISSKNTLLNKYLSKLAKLAGIEKKISMHISRHSFANIARQQKANVYDISKALGHSSIKITESYLSQFDTKSQDETLNKIYHGNQSKEDTLLKQLQGLNPEQLASILAKVKIG